MDRIIVYTCILNGYDNLRPPLVIEPGVRYICFSDEFHDCPPWEIRPAPRLTNSIARDSRIPKILPHLVLDAEYSIWHDGCFRMAIKPSTLVDLTLAHHDFAIHKHPCRTDIYNEMRVCLEHKIGDPGDIRLQVERYRARGVTEGLWAAGVLIRRHGEAANALNEEWWREFCQGSTRDQFAFVGARHTLQTPIATLHHNILEHPAWFAFMFHAAFIDHGDNATFVPSRKLMQARRERLEEIVGSKVAWE